MNEGDFIEFDYVGKTNEGIVFDTTIEDIGKKFGIKHTFKPIILCLGQGQLLKGLELALIGKELGKHIIKLEAKDAFGKKDAKLIQLVPLSKFLKDGLKPVPGMQVNIDGQIATIKRVSSGRVVVDFNHPMAGLELTYEVNVLKIITDLNVKVESFVANTYGNVKHDYKDGVVKLFVQTEVPIEVQKLFKENFKKVIPEIKDVTFIVENISNKI